MTCPTSEMYLFFCAVRINYARLMLSRVEIQPWPIARRCLRKLLLITPGRFIAGRFRSVHVRYSMWIIPLAVVGRSSIFLNAGNAVQTLVEDLQDLEDRRPRWKRNYPSSFLRGADVLWKFHKLLSKVPQPPGVSTFHFFIHFTLAVRLSKKLYLIAASTFARLRKLIFIRWFEETWKWKLDGFFMFLGKAILKPK